MDLVSQSALSVRALLAAGEISPLDLLDALQARIAAVDPEVNALPTLCFERAREQAASVSRDSLLAGIPVAIKDLSDVSGVRTTYACTLYSDHVPQDYIERCLARFIDSPDIVLVGPRADCYMEGEYWFSYLDYTNLGQTPFERLRDLIPVGYTAPSAFLQHFYGVYKRQVAADCIWSFLAKRDAAIAFSSLSRAARAFFSA